MITKDDFEKMTNGIVMKERAKQIFIEELENKLRTTINTETRTETFLIAD